MTSESEVPVPDPTELKSQVADDANGISSDTRDPGKSPWVRCLMQVLWPAFMGASISVGLLFSVVDPEQISWVQLYLDGSREASYTIGFLVFWILYSLTCGVTWYLASTQTPAKR